MAASAGTHRVLFDISMTCPDTASHALNDSEGNRREHLVNDIMEVVDPLERF